MQQWEYKIESFETSGAGKITGVMRIDTHLSFEKATTWTGKEKEKKTASILDNEGIQSLFNEWGQDSWELVGVLPLVGRTGFGESATGRVDFIFKRIINE